MTDPQQPDCPKCGEQAGFEQVGAGYFCRHCSGLTTRYEFEALVYKAEQEKAASLADHPSPCPMCGSSRRWDTSGNLPKGYCRTCGFNTPKQVDESLDTLRAELYQARQRVSEADASAMEHGRKDPAPLVAYWQALSAPSVDALDTSAERVENPAESRHVSGWGGTDEREAENA